LWETGLFLLFSLLVNNQEMSNLLYKVLPTFMCYLAKGPEATANSHEWKTLNLKVKINLSPYKLIISGVLCRKEG
jgi:hypothetical protein